MTKQKQSLIASFLIGFAILVGLDQWTKGLVVQSLKGQKPFVIWNGVFEFYYSENRGAAFGMMQEKQLFFFLIAVLVLGAVAYLIYKMPSFVSVMCFSGLIRLMSWHWPMVCMPLTIQVRHKKRFCNIPCLCVSTGK